MFEGQIWWGFLVTCYEKGERLKPQNKIPRDLSPPLTPYPRSDSQVFLIPISGPGLIRKFTCSPGCSKGGQRYPPDKSKSVVCFDNIYPLDSVIQHSNKGPGVHCIYTQEILNYKYRDTTEKLNLLITSS